VVTSRAMSVHPRPSPRRVSVVALARSPLRAVSTPLASAWARARQKKHPISPAPPVTMATLLVKVCCGVGAVIGYLSRTSYLIDQPGAQPHRVVNRWLRGGAGQRAMPTVL